MLIETYTSIEVANVPNIWAVNIFECTQEMEPVTPKFIFVHNGFDGNSIVNYVDHTLTDIKPEKIIPGVNGGIADHFKEVGFWRINYKV
jgi:hypothetical protein